MSYFRSVIRRQLIAGTSCLIGIPAVLGAQAQFPAPTREIDWKVYTVPEACIAAAERVRTMDPVLRSSRPDTVQDNPLDSVPTVVRRTTSKCLAQFDVSKATPANMEPFMRAALLTGNDSIVNTLIRRSRELIVSLSRKPDTTAVIDARRVSEIVIEQLVAAHPVRITMAKEYAASCDTLFPVTDTHGRLYPWSQLLAYSARVLDYALSIAAAQKVLSVTEHPPKGMDTADLKYLPEMNASMHAVIADAQLLVASPQEAYKRLSESGLQTAPGPLVGKPAPTVVGDYWFNTDTARKPRLGRVSLLAFLSPTFPTEERDAVLRRLARAFPQVDIVIMASTHGFVRHTVMPTPEAEAQQLNKYFRDVVHVPGALSVSVTPNARIPDPDGRRLEGLTINQQQYAIEEGITIVNQEGTVVLQSGISAMGERILAAVVTVLLEGGPSAHSTAQAGAAAH